MKNRSKNIIFILTIFFSLYFAKEVQSQSFFGYQTIGKNTFLFSLIWQGEPKIGFSYIYRNYTDGGTFSDIQGEVRFPLKEMFRFKDYDVMAGVYKPLSISRTFVGIGGHIRFEAETKGEQRIHKFSPAVTVIPSVTYVTSTTDGPYGTMGIRFTYAPIAYLNMKEKGKRTYKQAFAQHKFEGGLHIDLHLERTMALGLDGITKYNLYTEKSYLPEEDKDDWDVEGAFYFGATYWLER